MLADVRNASIAANVSEKLRKASLVETSLEPTF